LSLTLTRGLFLFHVRNGIRLERCHLSIGSYPQSLKQRRGFFGLHAVSLESSIAASNEDLLSIIERLDQRIEQLESNTNEAREILRL